MSDIFRSPVFWVLSQGVFATVMISGILPQHAAFILVGAVAIALLWMPLRYSTAVFLASVPLSFALPVPGFESFAAWRVWAGVLFLKWLWVTKPDIQRISRALFTFEYIVCGIGILALASLFVAQDPFLGLRKIFFLLNALILYPVLRMQFRDLEGRFAALRGIFIGAAAVFTVAFLQYFIVQFVSLFEFWQGWAGAVIPLFYGNELGKVISESNTWFSYYSAAPPTLRMFSVFPDSHSFGLFSAIIFVLCAWAAKERWYSRKAMLSLATISALAIFLSGSRGIWIAAIVPFVLLVPLAFTRMTRILRIAVPFTELKTALFAWLLLVPAFACASVISANARGIGVGSYSEAAAFFRARSIFDVTELSNRSRIQIWLTSLKSIKEKPFGGVGFGNIAEVFDEELTAARRGASAHNLYLDVGAEAGFAAGILLIAFFLDVFIFSLRRGLIFSALLASWIATYGLVDVVLLNDRVFIVFLAFISLTAVYGASTRATPTAT